MYYLTFFFLMLTSYLQWKSLKYFKSNDKAQRMRHIIVTFVFALGFLIRALFNTIQSVTPISFRDDHTYWNLFLVLYHLIAEIIPMTIVFSFQIHANRIRYQTIKQLRYNVCGEFS